MKQHGVSMRLKLAPPTVRRDVANQSGALPILADGQYGGSADTND